MGKAKADEIGTSQQLSAAIYWIEGGKTVRGEDELKRWLRADFGMRHVRKNGQTRVSMLGLRGEARGDDLQLALNNWANAARRVIRQRAA